ncbi:MAG TPA: ABC-type transport auxiliary lipoprotein family protein [Alphaproteobacteria bacterium]|nr:ABC-type transport auxiliary lipoprotein family protein [Alphaproteobacteria bacterium]
MRANIRLPLAAVVALVVSSCGVKLVDLGPAPNLYDIQTAPHFSKPLAPVSWQLVINEPTASTSLDTDRILLRPGNSEIKYIAGARWSERVPRLIQSQLLRAFDKSGAIVGVGRQAIGLHGDYELQGELSSFDTVYSGGATPMTEIAINFKVVRQPGEIIIASRNFEEKERATAPSLTAITASFGNVLSTIVGQAVPWTLTEAQRDFEQSAAKAHPAKPALSQSP